MLACQGKSQPFPGQMNERRSQEGMKQLPPLTGQENRSSQPQQVFREFPHRCGFQMNCNLLHLGFCDIVIFHPFAPFLLSPFSSTEPQEGSEGALAIVPHCKSLKVQWEKHPNHSNTRESVSSVSQFLNNQFKELTQSTLEQH